MFSVSRAQATFLRSDARTVIYRAGIRSGKTWVLCYKALQYAFTRRRFCIVSFSYPSLRDVAMHTTQQICGLYQVPYELNKSEKTISVWGQDILYRSGDSPDSLRGLSLDGYGIDEAREFRDRTVYDVLIGRLSNSATAQGYVTTSPRGKNWAYELESAPGVETIVQATADNPFLPDKYVASLRSSYTAQFAQQELEASIVDMGQGVIERGWFRSSPLYKPQRGVRFWDVATTVKKSSDYSAGALCSMRQGQLYIHDIDRGKWQYPQLRDRIIQRSREDGVDTVIAIELAGQQQAIIDDLRALPELRAYVIKAITPRGDKFARAMPWVSRAQLGGVVVCQGGWNNDFFDECEAFSGDGSQLHDDQIDAVSGAYQVLTAPKGGAYSITY